MACALIETFFRIVSTLSKNDVARDLFAMAILHFADAANLEEA